MCVASTLLVNETRSGRQGLAGGIRKSYEEGESGSGSRARGTRSIPRVTKLRG